MYVCMYVCMYNQLLSIYCMNLKILFLVVFIIKGLGAYDTNYDNTYDNNNKVKQKPIYKIKFELFLFGDKCYIYVPYT